MNKLGILLVIVLLSIPVCGCIGDGAEAKITSMPLVNDDGMASFKVTISANDSVDVVLLHDGVEIKSRTLQKRQFDDGKATVYIPACDSRYETPSGGEYIVKVYDGDKLLDQCKKTYDGPLLRIDSFKNESEPSLYLQEKYMTHAELKYSNIGDVPVYVCAVALETCKDTEEKYVDDRARCIMPYGYATLSNDIFVEIAYAGNCTCNIYLLNDSGYYMNEPYSIIV